MEKYQIVYSIQFFISSGKIFGGEIHRSTCRHESQTSPVPFSPHVILVCVHFSLGLASLRISCASWVLHGSRGVDTFRFEVDLWVSLDESLVSLTSSNGV
jgi:hypothetical protein